MSQTTLTINCDLGEGMSNEKEVVPLIDLASVACGGHFGDHKSVAKTLVLVKHFGKRAGAHPSYPDRENFGRKSLSIPFPQLIQSLKDQIQLFESLANKENVPLDHIKFHGALYNDAAENQELSQFLVDFLREDYPNVALFVPPYSELENAAIQNGHPIKREVFGDRAYLENYKLVSRSVENSLLTNENQVFHHLDSILNKGQILTNSGTLIPVHADTLCFHGDNPGIMKFLPFVRDKFWN